MRCWEIRNRWNVDEMDLRVQDFRDNEQPGPCLFIWFVIVTYDPHGTIRGVSLHTSAPQIILTAFLWEMYYYYHPSFIFEAIEYGSIKKHARGPQLAFWLWLRQSGPSISLFVLLPLKLNINRNKLDSLHLSILTCFLILNF